MSASCRLDASWVAATCDASRAEVTAALNPSRRVNTTSDGGPAAGAGTFHGRLVRMLRNPLRMSKLYLPLRWCDGEAVAYFDFRDGDFDGAAYWLLVSL